MLNGLILSNDDRASSICGTNSFDILCSKLLFSGEMACGQRIDLVFKKIFCVATEVACCIMGSSISDCLQDSIAYICLSFILFHQFLFAIQYPFLEYEPPLELFVARAKRYFMHKKIGNFCLQQSSASQQESSSHYLRQLNLITVK